MSSTAFSYIFQLRDKMSGPLRSISSSGASAYSKVIAAQKNYNAQVDAGNSKVKQMSSGIGGLGNMIRAYIGFQAVTGFFKLGAEMEQTRIAYQTLLGSVEKGNTLFTEINKLADITPYDNKTLLDSSRLMLGFGIAGEKIIPTLKMIGDVGAGNAEKMSLLSLAYSQVQSAGKLMGQDLLQFINAGFNPLQIISQKTGESLGVLKDKMSKGAISADMVSQAFVWATSEGGLFYQMMEKQAATLGGKWSTFMGSGTNLIARFSESNTSAFGSIVDGLISMVNWIDRNIKLVEGLIITVGAAVAGYYAWIGITKAWIAIQAIYKSILFVNIGLTHGWAVAQQALNMTMMANPIGLVIAAVVALVAGIIYAWNKFEGFRSVVLGVWEVVKGFAVMIKDYVVNRIFEFIQGITSLGKVIQLIFSGQFKEAAKVGASALGNMFIGNESAVAAYNQGKKLGGAWSTGYAKGKRPGAVGEEGSLATDGSGISGAGGLGEFAQAGATTADGITQGGQKSVTISTTIERLVENLNISSANITEGAGEMRDIIQTELIRALNGIVKVQGV